MPDNSSNKRPLRPLKSVAGRAKNARPKAGRYFNNGSVYDCDIDS